MKNVAALPIVVEQEEQAPLPYRQPPHNIEAEQALLGAILINNEALNHIGSYLEAKHFYEPVHQRIFDAIQKTHDRGLIANPVTLKHYFDKEEALAEVGGGQYLARLAGSALIVVNVMDYARTIYDLALKRALIGIGEETVNTAYDNNIERLAASQIEEAEQKLFSLASEGNSERSFLPIKASIADAIKRTELAYKNSGQLTGVGTELNDLDRLLGGMQKSDLIILAGRPSMGKTALATTMAYNSARYFQRQAIAENLEKPQSVGFFSLEMSGEQLASRMLSIATEINSNKLRKGDLTEAEFAKLATESQTLARLPFFIDDTPALSISALRTRARRLKRVNNLGMLVVDYLQLVRGSSTANNSNANRVQEVSEVTQGLKAIAKELNIPVLALSQLSRQVESRDDKRPLLSDLRESGSIEQDADVVMFVFREEYYLARAMPREDTPEFFTWQEEMNKVHGLAEVIIAKQRNGPIGNVLMQFTSELTRFGNLARQDYLPARNE